MFRPEKKVINWEQLVRNFVVVATVLLIYWVCSFCIFHVIADECRATHMKQMCTINLMF